MNATNFPVRIGAKGDIVEMIQLMLNKSKEIALSVDGDFGKATQAAVIRWQELNGFEITGEVSAKMFNELQSQKLKGTWLKGIAHSLLDDSQYVQKESDKVGICIHHTAGSENPYLVRDIWNRDDRGRVATHFVVGGISLKGDVKYDGNIVQTMPLENSAYHIAMSRMGFSERVNEAINSGYIGIEICNYGYLTKKGDKFYTYTDVEVDPKYVCTLDTPFRSSKYWHAYSDAQMRSLEWLVTELAAKFKFELSYPYEINAKWLDLDWDAMDGKRVLTTHTNFEFGKFDCYPAPNFLNALKRIYGK